MSHYSGRNVVTTNRSMPNHGKSATLKVQGKNQSVELTHWIDGGGKTTGIALDRSEALPALVGELIAYCPRSSLPRLLGAVGQVIASEG